MVSRVYTTRFIVMVWVLLLLGACSAHSPLKNESCYRATGMASYYADKFHGRKTASGQIYHKDKLTAAHRSLPFGTRLKVINLDNGREVEVRINDRGPFIKGRIIDVSYAAAKRLGMTSKGVVRVRVVQIR